MMPLPRSERVVGVPATGDHEERSLEDWTE